MQYELPQFEHVDVFSVAEAVDWLTRYGRKARLIAGGTDLLGLMKDRVTGPVLPLPEVLINIKPVPELNQIHYQPGKEIRIGAAVTLWDIEAHPAIRGRFTALAQAAACVGTTQIRSVGTIGGNLCQRPWCSYFRHPQYICFKKGGRQCYAITGHNRYYFACTRLGICVMSHPSDLAPALIALNARVVIAGANGERTVRIENFFRGPRSADETVVQTGETLVRVEIAQPSPNSDSVFLKKRIRGSWDFALSEVAVSMTRSGRVCDDVRLALGGVAPMPFRARAAEEVLRGKVIREELIESAAAAAIQKPRPLRMNAYKLELTRTLVRRALTAISDAASGSRAGVVSGEGRGQG